MLRGTSATLLALAVFATAAPAPKTRAEIDALLGALRSSGCQFQRNGTWYDGAAASDHLQTKREWLEKRDRIATAEDFIRQAGTESSMSGKAYVVKCPDKPAVESRAWLQARLAALRAPRAP